MTLELYRILICITRHQALSAKSISTLMGKSTDYFIKLFDYLEQRDYIEEVSLSPVVDATINENAEYSVTQSGKIAISDFKYVLETRFISWAALAVSIAAIIISICH